MFQSFGSQLTHQNSIAFTLHTQVTIMPQSSASSFNWPNRRALTRRMMAIREIIGNRMDMTIDAVVIIESPPFVGATAAPLAAILIGW